MTGWEIKNTDLILTGKSGQFSIVYVHWSHFLQSEELPLHFQKTEQNRERKVTEQG